MVADVDCVACGQPHIDSKTGQQVVIVSLLSYCCLDFYRNSGRKDLSVPFTPTLARSPPNNRTTRTRTTAHACFSEY
jgi:hypothetical protein